MYILQISDLHISTESNTKDLITKINLLCTKIKSLTNTTDDSIVCCILGDFINKGESKAFASALTILEKFRENLYTLFSKEKVEFILIPGNHDLCINKNHGNMDLEEFNNFRSMFELNPDISKYNHSIRHISVFGYNFIAINSVFKNIKEYGQVDLEEIEELLTKKINCEYTIMLSHHALISSDDEDKAALRNGYSLLKFIEEHKTIALLHGHTHGFKRFSVGDDQQIIGVGPMFKNINNISNQCNLIKIEGTSIRSIQTLTYHGDRKEWDCIDTYIKKYANNYSGHSINEIYSRVLNDANFKQLLPNIKIEIEQDFDKLEEEILSNFSESLISAELWQSHSLDKSLSYTHSQLMNNANEKWEDFIIKTLTEKPTSKRAIIPLLDKSMTYKGGDGELVSFDIVQFGFPNDESNHLVITIYLRALELKSFLPVNICEAYLMAKKLKKHFKSIKKVTICLIAGKSEAKEEYGCYRKSQLDIVSESRICKLFQENNYTEIKSYLIEKLHMSDTVINENWIAKIKNAVIDFFQEINKEELLKQIALVEINLNKYKQDRERNSNYFETKPQEDILKESIFKLANMFGEIKNE